MTTDDVPWWQKGVLYEVYVRSFADSNGDGIGDIPGITSRLDHLRWLGIDGIWLSPITVSPNADWGYDVADFCAVQPELGTLEDLDRLVAEAGAAGIRILLDLVPNHTSIEHRWFDEARSSPRSARRNWYVWADAKTDGSPPNNWVSSFGGPAWRRDPPGGQYYLHNHLPEQPDLNWWNEEVRAAFDDILRFWLDRGVAGFRIDVCNVIVKDAELRDNPPATVEDDLDVQLLGQRPVYNANRPEVHEILRRWRVTADAYDPPRVLLGETPVALDALGRYYGDGGDELHLAFNFPFLTAAFEADELRKVVEATEAVLPPGAWPAWTGSNHDMSRLASRWAAGDAARTRAALMILLCLRGTPVLYQGDEIGLGDVRVDRCDMRDPLGVRYYPAYVGRDAMRTPLPWRPGPGRGFTAADVAPWLPIGDSETGTVEEQRLRADSVLLFVRDLIGARRRSPDLQVGSYRSLPGPAGVWAWRRGEETTVVVNLSERSVTCDSVEGVVTVATDRRRDGEEVGGTVSLSAWEGVVVGPGPR